MANNKVQLADGTVLIDLTADTVTADKLMQGYTAHDASGAQITGTASGGGAVVINDTTDVHGGTIREITAVVISGTKAITSAGTTDVASYANASVAAGTEGTPTASKGAVSNHAITVTPSVTNTAGYISGGTHSGTGVSVAASELVSGSQTITSNDTYDVTNLASVVVNVSSSSSKNVQAYRGYDTVSSTSYTATDLTLTVAKTGTYNVSWMGYRNTTSGTSGSQLYKNGTAVGTANTTFVNTYGHSVSLTNQSFNQGDVLVVRARARSASYVMGVGNLIIEEV